MRKGWSLGVGNDGLKEENRKAKNKRGIFLAQWGSLRIGLNLISRASSTSTLTINFQTSLNTSCDAYDSNEEMNIT